MLRALDYEVRRQTELLEEGGSVVQETRLWDDDRDETRPMRTKEEAHDYRYFPEPDLPPFHTDREVLARLQASLPELRDAKRKRFVEDFGLPEYDAAVLAEDRGVADFLDECCAAHPQSAKVFSNWIMTNILGELKDEDAEISDLKVTAKHLIELDQLIADGKISANIAKKLFRDMLNSGEMPAALVAKKGIKQADEGAVEKAVDEAIAENPDPWKNYQAGKDAALNFLLGQVMRKTRGQADPGTVRKLFQEKAQG